MKLTWSDCLLFNNKTQEAQRYFLEYACRDFPDRIDALGGDRFTRIALMDLRDVIDELIGKSNDT